MSKMYRYESWCMSEPNFCLYSTFLLHDISSLLIGEDFISFMTNRGKKMNCAIGLIINCKWNFPDWIFLLTLLRHIIYMASTPTRSGCGNMMIPACATFDTLPVEIITYIMNCLSYDDISLLRAVSQLFIPDFPNLNYLLWSWKERIVMGSQKRMEWTIIRFIFHFIEEIYGCVWRSWNIFSIDRWQWIILLHKFSYSFNLGFQKFRCSGALHPK